LAVDVYASQQKRKHQATCDQRDHDGDVSHRITSITRS
jgi:hypothetical protein